MVQLCLLGTGSPNPLPERLGPGVLLSYGGEHLLFDAGRGVTTQLVRAGVEPQDLAAIFLTHHHYDHIGNLGDLLLTAWHGGSTRLPVIGPQGTGGIVKALFEQVYAREIAFSLTLARATGTSKADIREVVSVTPIGDGQTYRQGTWTVRAAAVDHGHRLGLTQEEWPCLAYRIEVGGKAIVISGDTVACARLVELARGADLLVQCCFLAEAELTTPGRQLLARDVIATSGQAGKIAAQAGVKALALTHFSSADPGMMAAIQGDVQRDFGGKLTMGTDLLRIDV